MGLIARQLEAAGIATICLTSALSITESVGTPRAAFVDFPLGHTSGPPDDPDLQTAIVRGAFEALEQLEQPGEIVRLGHRWPNDEWRDDPMGARAAGGDSRGERTPQPVYQAEADAELAATVPEADQCLVCVGLDPGMLPSPLAYDPPS